MLELSSVQEDSPTVCALVDVYSVPLVGAHRCMALGTRHFTHNLILCDPPGGVQVGSHSRGGSNVKSGNIVNPCPESLLVEGEHRDHLEPSGGQDPAHPRRRRHGSELSISTTSGLIDSSKSRIRQVVCQRRRCFGGGRREP